MWLIIIFLNVMLLYSEKSTYFDAENVYSLKAYQDSHDKQKNK
jgi:hypothetical protein